LGLVHAAEDGSLDDGIGLRGVAFALEDLGAHQFPLGDDRVIY
jgi:hypothetical protein